MRFVILTMVSFLATPLLLNGQTLSPGSAHYIINYQGKDAGSASYTIAATPGGYSIAARGDARIGTINLAFSKNEELDSKLEIVSEALNGTLNSEAVFVAVKVDGAKFDIDTSANGKRLSNVLDRNPHTIFAPDFDPSAILLFLRHAGYSTNLWGLIPQQSGLLVSAKVTPQKDEKGTLKGSPIVVRHSTLVMANVTSELFSTVDGQLLQQEVPTQGFSMVRDGFILTPPKAAAPQPAASPMPSSDVPPTAN